jgi:hypothetical protein
MTDVPTADDSDLRQQTRVAARQLLRELMGQESNSELYLEGFEAGLEVARAKMLGALEVR